MSFLSLASASRSRGLEYSAGNFRRQALGLALQPCLRRLAILLDVSLRRLHLRLSFIAGFVQRSRTRIERGLAPAFLSAEHGCPRLPQPLLIFGRTRFSRRDISPRLLNRTLRKGLCTIVV
jgi:hypothetical protein